MLRLFRARACCLVTVIALATGTMAAAFGELVHAGRSHDAACVPGTAHDASSHRYKAPADGGSADDHCVGCHFARSPRIGAQSIAHGGHVDEACPLRPVAALGSARAAALDNLPPRSPPSLS